MVTEEWKKAHAAAVEARARGDRDSALVAVDDLVGRELVAFFVLATKPRYEDARDLYMELCERLVTALPRFESKNGASLRTYIYVIAHRVLIWWWKQERKRPPETRLNTDMVSKIRETFDAATAGQVQQQHLDRMCEILDPKEREILWLRVDRDMPWRDVTIVMHGADLTPKEAKQKNANLRGAYRTLCRKLRQLARDEGLAEESADDDEQANAFRTHREDSDED